MRTVILLPGALLLLLVTSPEAIACTCGDPLDPEPAFDSSDAVFEATVQAVRVAGTEREVDLIVTRSWKGVQTRSVVVWTFASEALCGYPFQIGVAYLVYAADTSGRGGESRWSTSVCRRTRPMTEAAEDLAFLSGRTIVDVDGESWGVVKARF
ncbi:MAG TPA: hypothetical protein VKA86_08085 [Candidatus Krumholzibacteria bacterium]|nr:hypothetical protein [Candidatus Krumholzibacteria bacterium]